jgi:DNA invertase Pin-like site-specific DNA recombinase
VIARPNAHGTTRETKGSERMTTFEKNRIIDEALKLDVWAIYLRKSRADMEAEKLGEGETLARHKKILLELAARKGLYVGEIYQEIVSGADSIEDRPEIQRLISDCYAGKYRGILIVEVTRLSRGSQGDAQKIMDCLKYANRNQGLLVATPTKVYDIAHNPDDEEYMEFELFMSRREYKMIKRRMDRGREQAVVEGNYMGSYRPYGYDILKTKTARTLIPNAEEAPIVKLIFEWTVKENISPRKIATRLDTMGVPTYSGDPEWSIATIKTILTNPTYAGKVKWNDRMRVKIMQNGELVTSRPRSNHTDKYMEYDGKHKDYALVDEETFKAASSRFYSDHTKAEYKLQNPLAGLLFCKNCGKAMVYQPYKNRENTAPRMLHRQSAQCKVKSVIADDVISAVVHSMRLYIEDFQMRVDNLPDVDENTIQAQIEALYNEKRKTEKKLAKAFDDYEDGVYTANEFVQRKAKHNARIESIEMQIRELENSIPERVEYEELTIMFSEALEMLQAPDLDAEVKNEYLKKIFSRIEFSRENNEEFILDIDIK